MKAALLFAFLVTGGPAGREESSPIGRVQVERSEGPRGAVYTVHGTIVPLKQVLEELAAKAGYRLEGLDSGVAATFVNVALEKRPLTEILHVLLGASDLSFSLENGEVRVESLPLPFGEEGKRRLEKEGVQATYDAFLRFPEHPDATRLNLLMGDIDEREGRIEEANRRYQGIIRNFPKSAEVPQALLRLGRNFVRSGQYERASGYLLNLLKDFRKAEGLDEAYFLFGFVWIQLGNVERAVEYLKIVTDEFPNSPFQPLAKIHLADALRRSDRTPEALEILRALESKAMGDLTLRPEFLLVNGRALLASHQHPSASSFLFRFAGENPKRVEASPAMFQAAEAAFRAGDLLGSLMLAKSCEGASGVGAAEWERLAAEIRRALQLKGFLDPREEGAKALSAAESLRAKGRVEEAIELLHRHFDDPAFGARAMLAAGRYSLEKKDPLASIQILRRAIPVSDDAELVNEAFRLLGDAYTALGRHEEAAEAYQGILRRNP